MGLNDESKGMFSMKDYSYTKSFSTYSEKKKANIKVISERLNKYKFGGLGAFFMQKIAITWSNGNYDYQSKYINVDRMNGLYEYVSGNKAVFLVYFLQICKVTILLIVLCSFIRDFKEKKYMHINIAILGAFIFYIVWEAKERYSLSFLPWMFLLFGYGISGIEKFLKVEKVKISFSFDKIQNVDARNIIKWIMKIVFTISVILLSISYYKYAVHKEYFLDSRVVQGMEQGQPLKISNKTIQQEFKTKKSFNYIALKFKKNNVKTDTNYKFVIKNKTGKILVEQCFTSAEVENNKYKSFKFQTIKSKEGDFLIEISSTDASDNNSLDICVFDWNGYSAYPEGNLIINNEIKEKDLNFLVMNNVNRTYIKAEYFIILYIFIVGVEFVAFREYLKK